MVELERRLLAGEDMPGEVLVLQELRRDQRDNSRAKRSGNLSRLFFQPLRTISGRRYRHPRSSRPHRTHNARAGLGMDRPRPDARSGESRHRAGGGGLRTRRRRSRRAIGGRLPEPSREADGNGPQRRGKGSRFAAGLSARSAPGGLWTTLPPSSHSSGRRGVACSLRLAVAEPYRSARRPDDPRPVAADEIAGRR